MRAPHAPDRLTETEAAELCSYVETVGEREAAQELGVTSATLARGMARLWIQRSTAQVFRLRLPELRRPAA